MNRILLIFVILMSLAGCAFDESQLLIPNFGIAQDVEPPQVEFISWQDLYYNDLESVANDSSCSMIYITHAFCQDCDEVNEKIFKDFDTVEKIRYSFFSYRVNQDNEDFQSIMNVFNQKDVPIIVFLHGDEIILWNREAGFRLLKKTIAELSKECQIGHHY